MQNERGQILVLTALILVVLLGVSALALDAGYAYDKRNVLSAAADAAAKAAAFEVQRAAGTTNAVLTCFAQHEIEQFAPLLDAGACGATGRTTVVARRCNNAIACPQVGARPEFVQITLFETTPTFFGRLLGWTGLQPTARAVAGPYPSPNCIVVFSDFSVGATVTASTCGVEVGGQLSGGGGITASNIGAGSWDGNGAMVPSPTTPIPAPADPLAGATAPAIPGSGCGPGAGASLSPGCYTTITVGNNGTLTLDPGLYVITDGLTTGTNATLTGLGVTLYFGPAATVSVGTGNAITLSAQTGTAQAGIAWFFDRANANPITLSNDSGFDVTGAFYAKASAVTAGNHMGNAGNCALIVVGTLTINNGSGQFDNTCTGGGFSGSTLKTVALAQ